MGGKSGPAPPPAPDPNVVSAAQTRSNIDTATANANLNRIDQTTPYGSLTYQINGTNPDGTPKYSQTQTFAPTQQAQFDQYNALASSLLGFGSNELGNVQKVTQTPLSFDGLTPVQGGVNAGDMQFGINRPDYASFVDNAGPIQRDIGNSGDIVSGGTGGGPIQHNINGAGPIQSQTAYSGPVQSNIAGAGPIQSQTAYSGPVQFGLGNTGPVQSGLDFSRLTNIPGISDFSADRQRAEDAAYNRSTARLDPQFATQQSGLESRLANMGVVRGSDAWNREFDALGRTRTDAYGQARNDAISQGSNEQSRLFGLAMGARQEGANETTTAGNFANSAQAQRYGQELNTGQFYNAGQQQYRDQNVVDVNLANQAQQQRYGQNASDAQFANQAQQQRYGQNANDAQFYNQAQQQQYGQNASDATFANTAQAQTYAQSMQDAGFWNAAQAQAYVQNASDATFANQAQHQQYTQNAADATFYNDSSDRIFGTDLAANNFANQAQQQSYGQQANNVHMNNAARQQQEQELAYLHSAPLNELATIMGTAGSVQQPQFSSVPGVNMANTDVSGNAYSSYQGNYNAWQQQQAARSQALGGIFGLLGTAASFIPSDRRIKERIKRIGETAHGIATYVFSYLGEQARQFGVMAQDVVHIPGAVAMRNGVMQVNYGKVW